MEIIIMPCVSSCMTLRQRLNLHEWRKAVTMIKRRERVNKGQLRSCSRKEIEELAANREVCDRHQAHSLFVISLYHRQRILCPFACHTNSCVQRLNAEMRLLILKGDVSHFRSTSLPIVCLGADEAHRQTLSLSPSLSQFFCLSNDLQLWNVVPVNLLCCLSGMLSPSVTGREREILVPCTVCRLPLPPSVQSFRSMIVMVHAVRQTWLALLP